MERERITISIKKEVLEKLDQKIDGIKMRNRSHAIELMMSDMLGVAKIDTGIIMAGGKGALRLIPVIEEVVKSFKDYGLSDIYIALGFLGDKIKQSIGDGSNFGLKISYIEGGEGTAGALSLIRDKVKKTFVVANLEQITNISLAELINFHFSHTPLVSVATSNTKQMKGFYVLEPEVFSLIPKDFSMLEEDVFPKLTKENKLLIFPVIN
jgi:NDP-sugar pyrophosphorylase family protein